MGDDDLKQIEDLENFLIFLKIKSFKVFLTKMFGVWKEIYEADDICIKHKDVEWIKDRLDDIELLKDVENFILSDEDQNLFITDEDYTSLVLSVSNDMVGSFLNKLVDDGLLEMCWDPKIDEFIWRSKET